MGFQSHVGTPGRHIQHTHTRNRPWQKRKTAFVLFYFLILVNTVCDALKTEPPVRRHLSAVGAVGRTSQSDTAMCCSEQSSPYDQSLVAHRNDLDGSGIGDLGWRRLQAVEEELRTRRRRRKNLAAATVKHSLLCPSARREGRFEGVPPPVSEGSCPAAPYLSPRCSLLRTHARERASTPPLALTHARMPRLSCTAHSHSHPHSHARSGRRGRRG